MVILTQGAKSYVLDIHVNGRKKFYTTCSVNLYIGVTQRSLIVVLQLTTSSVIFKFSFSNFQLSPRPVLHKLIQFFSCHWKLGWIFIDPLQKIFFYFVCPLRVDLTRCIFSFTQTLMAEFISKADKFCINHNFLASAAGIKTTPPFFASTASPGITVALPMRMGTLIPASIICCM